MPDEFSAAPDRPLRLVAQAVAKDDPVPEALAGYGLLVRWWDAGSAEPLREPAWQRFVDGRPVSSVTTRLLGWCCARLPAAGKMALLLVWDNAAWHLSEEVKTWSAAHNRAVQATGSGVRLVPCPLPSKNPWLNPIEPKWNHTKRQVVEPDRLLSAGKLAERVCAALGCAHEPVGYRNPVSQAATRSSSWSRPPRRSRRRTGPEVPGCGGGPSGGRSPRLRCGRARLW
jgi:hypothetical protein